jgi:spermidine synthase
VVTQADNLVFCPYSLDSILQLFQTVFPKVGHYQALVPSFGGYSAFAWGSHFQDIKSVHPTFEGRRYLNPSTYEIAFTPLGF